MATIDTLAAAMARRRRPPPMPPGFRHYLSERHSVPAAQQVLHDGSLSPAGTGPFKRKQPRVRQSGSPDRYYANRPHRPRWN